MYATQWKKIQYPEMPRCQFSSCQTSSMTGENLKLLVDHINRPFEKAEAVDGGSEDGVQIVVIGLLVTVFWLAVEA